MASVSIGNRMPRVRSPIGARLKWAMIAGLVLCAAMIGYGYWTRVRQQEVTVKRVEARVEGGTAKPAESNRAQVEDATARRAAQTGEAALAAAIGQGSTGVPAVPIGAVNGQQYGTQPMTAPGTGCPPYCPANAAPPPSPVVAPIPQAAAVPEEDPAIRHQRELKERLEKMREDAELEPVRGSGSGSVTAAAQPADPLQSQINQLSQMGLRPTVPGMAPGMVGEREPEYDPNGQRNKAKFDREEESGDYLKSSRVAPISQFVIEPPDSIPATLTTKVVSDLPGDMVAIVSKDVFDSPTHRYILIPSGSLLVGSYNSLVAYGQGQVQQVWDFLRFPDGSTIHLDKFRGAGADGSSGLRDQVDNHYKRLIGGVVFRLHFRGWHSVESEPQSDEHAGLSDPIYGGGWRGGAAGGTSRGADYVPQFGNSADTQDPARGTISGNGAQDDGV